MKRVELMEHEQQAYEVIQAVAAGRMKSAAAAIKLNKSQRHIRRLVTKYKQTLTQSNQTAKELFRHGNCGKQSNRKISTAIDDMIIALYTQKYNGFSYAHFHEHLVADEPPLEEPPII